MLTKFTYNLLLIKVLIIFFALSCYAQFSSSKKDTIKSAYVENRVDTLNQRAYRLRDSDITQAKAYLNESIVLAKNIDYQKGLVKALGLMGLLDLRLGEYESAIKNHFKSLTLAEKILDSQQIAFRYNDIANIYQAEGYYEQSLTYYTKSLEVKQKIKDIEGIATTYNNIAGIYIRLKQYAKALVFIKKAQKVLKNQNFPRVLGINYCYYAEVLNENLKYDSALYYFEKAIIIQKKYGNEYNQIVNITGIGYVYAKQKKYDIAIQYYLEALNKANTFHIKQLKNTIYQRLADAYIATNNFEIAYNYQKKLTELNDSLYHQKYDDKIMLLESKRELDEKEAQILIFKQDNQIQIEQQKQHEIWLLLALITILFFTLFGFLAIRNLKEKNNSLALLSAQKSEIEQKNEKLYDLNVEKDGLIDVVAHDLRSPLNRIKGLMTLLKMDGELVESQREYVKMVEKSCESGIALIKDLLLINDAENEKSYLQTTKIELNKFMADIVYQHQLYAQKKQINIIFTKNSDNIDFETEISFLERILDNLLSNATKFSFPNSTIYVNILENNQEISIAIKDEGQGMSEIDKTKVFKKFQKLSAQPTAGEDSTGLGLSIVKALIEKIKGEIDIASELGKGTQFTIKFAKKI